MPPKVPAWLLDAQRAAEQAVFFVEGMTLAEFESDTKTQLAVERLFTIIGEALNRVRTNDPATAKLLPDIHIAIAFRNAIVHEYDEIEEDSMWLTVIRDLPGFISAVDALISDLPDSYYIDKLISKDE